MVSSSAQWHLKYFKVLVLWVFSLINAHLIPRHCLSLQSSFWLQYILWTLSSFLLRTFTNWEIFWDLKNISTCWTQSLFMPLPLTEQHALIFCSVISQIDRLLSFTMVYHKETQALLPWWQCHYIAFPLNKVRNLTFLCWTIKEKPMVARNTSISKSCLFSSTNVLESLYNQIHKMYSQYLMKEWCFFLYMTLVKFSYSHWN